MKKYEVVYGNNPPLIFEADSFSYYGANVVFSNFDTYTIEHPRFFGKPRLSTHKSLAQVGVFTAPTNNNYSLLETLVVRELL